MTFFRLFLAEKSQYCAVVSKGASVANYNSCVPDFGHSYHCDFHGHNRKNNCFIYGCSATHSNSKENKNNKMNNTNKSKNLAERVFTLLLQHRCPDYDGVAWGGSGREMYLRTHKR